MRKSFILFVWLAAGLPFFLSAQYFQTPRLLVPYTSNAPEIGSVSAVMIDVETGALLYAKNPDKEIPPASLTKLMTLHLLMKEIEEGRASYDELVPITVESWAQSQPPGSSLMFLAPGQIVTLREIMLGLSVSSGNDAAVAAALRLAPSMRDFAEMMTAEARGMGLNVTRFTEASGYSEENMTTAAEYAYFCRRYLRLHPDALRNFHSVYEFAYPKAGNVPEHLRSNPRTIVQYNRNSMLISYPGVDGLKTGYIDEAGYNIALTAQRYHTRFLAVILGAPAVPGGEHIRTTDGERLLTWAFENFKTVRPVIDHDVMEEYENFRLWKGKENIVKLKPEFPLDFTSPVNRANELLFEIDIQQPLTAPLPEGFTAGFLVVSDEHGELNRAPLVTTSAYQKGNIFKRLWHSILILFKF